MASCKTKASKAGGTEVSLNPMKRRILSIFMKKKLVWKHYNHFSFTYRVEWGFSGLEVHRNSALYAKSCFQDKDPQISEADEKGEIKVLLLSWTFYFWMVRWSSHNSWQKVWSFLQKPCQRKEVWVKGAGIYIHFKFIKSIFINNF